MVSSCDAFMIFQKNILEYNSKRVTLILSQYCKDSKKYDVLVMPNVYGDIFPDMCASLVGALGLAPSGNIVRVTLILSQYCKDPKKYDVLVMSNLYGDIFSDMCASFVGGLGLAPPGNIDLNRSIELPQKSVLFSAVMMLRHMEPAAKIQRSCFDVIKEGKYFTGYLVGRSKCSEFTNEICAEICTT